MTRFIKTIIAGILITITSQAYSQDLPTTPLTGCGSSATVNAWFREFGRSGHMPPVLGHWLADSKSQIVKPWQAFDNVYFVGVCWVSSWLVKTSAGPVLIDTLYEPFTEQLLDNIRKVGVDPADIKLVLVTHGHFDHAGGIARLNAFTHARFAMTQRGWDEAHNDAKKSQGSDHPWTMPATDEVVKDGDILTVGDTRFYVYETPGHTWGTASYALDVTDHGKRYRAITIGGLGLNAIDGPAQVEAYIQSIDRIKGLVNDAEHPVTVHLTAHPFSNGLMETAQRLNMRTEGQENPLVDKAGLLAQLATLREQAVARLAIEKQKVEK